MHPNRLVVRAYLSRGGRIWLAIRAMAAAAFLIAGARAGAFGLSPGFTLQMILWSVVLSFVDTRRRGERALLGNLGVHPATLGALFAGAAIIGEGTLWLAGAVLR